MKHSCTKVPTVEKLGPFSFAKQIKMSLVVIQVLLKLGPSVGGWTRKIDGALEFSPVCLSHRKITPSNSQGHS